MKRLLLLLLFILPLMGCGDLMDGLITTNVNQNGDFMYKIVEKQVSIVSLYDNHLPEVVIPETVQGYPVTKIENNACRNFNTLVKIVFPSSVISIGTNLLTGCTALKEVTIPFTEEASYLKYYFGGMENDAMVPSTLKKVNVASGVKKIYSDCFYGISSVQQITIPESVTEIGARAFKNMQSLKTISFTGNLSLEQIEASAFDTLRFQNQKELEGIFYEQMISPAILVNDTVSQAYKNYFSDCMGKETYLNIYRNETIQNDSIIYNQCLIKYLGEAEEYTVPDGIISIFQGAFKENQTLVSVSLSADVRVIEQEAFSNMMKLEKIVLNQGLLTIEDNVFSNDCVLKTIVFGDNLKEIGIEVFSYCPALEVISIPTSVKIIGSYVFKGDSKTLIVSVPYALESIPEGYKSDWLRGLSASQVKYLE